MRNFNSGFNVKQSGYSAFQPNLINKEYNVEYTDLLPILEKANIKLGELNAYSDLVPDVDHFIRLHVIKEATVSSKIEGTHTNMEDALLQEDEVNPEKRNDWREVNNYIEAMNECIASLDDLPLSSRMLRKAHSILLQGVRGEHKMPGEFRRSQNWIGGATLTDAIFIPPVFQEVGNLMSDLEKFIHNEDTNLPHVFKIALAHYQFETIHPFLDGNGRIGRLLITLYFIEKKILKKPVLYLSDFFERNKSFYYDNLMRVRIKNDLKQWLKFFSVGIIEMSEKSIQGLKNIIELKEECEQELLPQLGKKMPNAAKLLQYLFLTPIIRANEVSQITGLSAVSSYNLINDFVDLDILREFTGFQRNRIFIFNKYFDVFKS
ncbi:MAG: Fic family protein [Cytophagales bacterium]|nr:Fic family protein [Cytophagales bacterium]